MIKKIIKKLQFNSDENIYDIIKKIKFLAIHTNNTPIAFITNRTGKCIGTLTLSDFYRLKNKKNLKAKYVMNKKFIYINKNNSENLILRKFEKSFLDNDPNIKTIPVLDSKKKIVDLINFKDFQKKNIFLKSSKKPKNKFINVRIPARLSFSGGGTDFSNLIDKSKIYILASSINKFINIEINVLNSKSQYLFIEGKKINIRSKQNQNRYRLIYKILDFYNISFGYSLKIDYEFSRGSGLGGSSALTVAIVSGLDKIIFDKVNLKHVINKAYRIERIDSKISGGWQDFFTSTYGGFCWITMDKKGIDVKKIRLSKKIINNIEKNLIFFKFGQSRDSSKIQSKLEYKINKSKFFFKKLVLKMNNITHEIKYALKLNNIKKLGKLQHKNWLLKKKINQNISNHVTNNLYSKIINLGAYGGKILGAGDAGYLMINSDIKYQKEIIRYLSRFGYKEERMKFTQKGVEISNKKL